MKGFFRMGKGLLRAFLGSASVVGLLGFSSSFAQAQSAQWTVRKAAWSAADEKKFSEFVQTMGESGCNSLDSCIKSRSANPFYYNKTPKNYRYMADCADLPFALRMYFSWMEGLPFDYVSEVTPAPGNGPSKDIRYTKNGNRPSRVRSFTVGNTYNGPQEMRTMTDAVSTAMYRMHYQYVSDFYPMKLDLNNVRPGTVMYDPSGHAAMIYKIEKNGLVRMFDAHPDQSISHIIFSKKFSRSRVAHGAGFKNWRPELSQAPTEDLPGFSTIEFAKSFELNGTELDYYDYVRAQMSGGNLNFDPVEEISDLMTELCNNIQERVGSVNTSLAAGLQNQSHPSRLPDNIYGTSGDWESYSTPSRDARLKTAFKELKDEAQRYLQMYQDGSSRVLYSPRQSAYSKYCDKDSKKGCYLVASLLELYDGISKSPTCHFEYTNSRGSRVGLSFEDVTARLFKLSFDPYHCVELRWGATGGNEGNTCPDGGDKRAWYDAEQGLRNQLERTYDAYMGYGREETRQKLGVGQAPDVNLRSFLESSLQSLQR
jgi:hypothetical protein